MAKTTKTFERVYNIPLRKEYMKAPRWNRTKKAAKALREFLAKHMKSDKIKLSDDINKELWKHGIRNPPHHIKVNAAKNEEGEVKAELFGIKKESPKEDEKKVKEKPSEQKKEESEEKEELETLQKEKPEPKVEKLPEKKDERATQPVPSAKNQLN